MVSRLLAERGQHEIHLREEFDAGLRTLEDERTQLRKKVAGLEAALKMTAEKFESDQKAFQTRHEGQLSAEKQVNLKLRGETAILKKSVNGYEITLFFYFWNFIDEITIFVRSGCKKKWRDSG